MKTTKLKELVAIAAMAVAVVGCCPQQGSTTCADSDCAEKSCKAEAKYTKKYTNADFYTDGKFNEAVAIEAMKDMLKFYEVPFTSFMEGNFWVAEFGVGDFENVGMGGIFWVNDEEHGYFAHTIYLLPGQMIPEHAHFPTHKPAKFESWMLSKGWAYNCSEIGEPVAEMIATPASHGPIKSTNYVKQEVGEIIHLKKIESYHILMAGDEGAIVEEWASFHDNAGLRFTNSGAAL